VDQTDLLAGRSETSAREGYLYWMGDKLYGVKWRNFKLRLDRQMYMFDPSLELPFGDIVNLVADPHEREPVNHRYVHTWTRAHFGRLLAEFEASVAREPLIPPGAPVDHVPNALPRSSDVVDR
jgi:arylsulfatase